MKFELKPYKRAIPKDSKDVSDKELVEDVIRVARHLSKDAVTREEYNLHGKYSVKGIYNRFGGSWFNILSAAGLSRTRSPMHISREELIADLTRVAAITGKQSVTHDDYAKHGKYNAGTFSNHFGSWFKAVDAAGLQRSRVLGVTEKEYFRNIEEVWIKLGRQPNYAEMEKPLSRYCVGAYEHRFGTWRKALEAFVTYVNGEHVSENTEQSALPVDSNESSKAAANSLLPEIESQKTKSVKRHTTRRQVSDRLRFLVMRRDRFACRLCGRSPATHPGTDLVIDHCMPWAKGGESTYDNLQTLCRRCNGGASDLEKTE